MKKPETKIKNAIYDFLVKEIDGYWLKMTGSPFQRDGIPDIIGCPSFSGKFTAIEVKKDEYEKPTRLQSINLKQVKDSKGISLVFYKFDEEEKHRLIECLTLSKVRG